MVNFCVCMHKRTRTLLCIYNVLLLNGGPCCVCPPIISRATHMKIIISLLFISPSNDSTWIGICTYSQFPPRNDRLKSIQFNSPATQDKTRVLKDTAHFPGVIPYNKRRHHLYRLPYIPIYLLPSRPFIAARKLLLNPIKPLVLLPRHYYFLGPSPEDT